MSDCAPRHRAEPRQHLIGVCRRAAACSCGWIGPRRATSAEADADAEQHARETADTRGT